MVQCSDGRRGRCVGRVENRVGRLKAVSSRQCPCQIVAVSTETDTNV